MLLSSITLVEKNKFRFYAGEECEGKEEDS